MDILAMLLADGYKHTHFEQFSPGTTKLVSYLTPRKSRLKSQDKMVLFGLQAFCKKYLIDYFDDNFFFADIDDVIREYSRVLDTMFGKDVCNVEKIENSHPDFAWVVQFVESLLSSEIWKPCIHANVGLSYREVVDKYYNLTVDDNIPHHKAMCDFGFRGMSCLQEAMKASASVLAWVFCHSA